MSIAAKNEIHSSPTGRARRWALLALVVAATASTARAHGPWYSVNRNRTMICQSAHVFTGYSPSRHDLQNPHHVVGYNTLLTVSACDDYACRLSPTGHYLLRRCMAL